MNHSLRRSTPQSINKPGENGNNHYSSNYNIIGENTGKTLNGKTDANLRLIADFLPLIAWIADINGNPEYFNHYWFEYTGHAVDDSLENNLLINLIHPDDRDRVRKKWDRQPISPMSLARAKVLAMRNWCQSPFFHSHFFANVVTVADNNSMGGADRSSTSLVNIALDRDDLGRL